MTGCRYVFFIIKHMEESFFYFSTSSFWFFTSLPLFDYLLFKEWKKRKLKKKFGVLSPHI